MKSWLESVLSVSCELGSRWNITNELAVWFKMS